MYKFKIAFFHTFLAVPCSDDSSVPVYDYTIHILILFFVPVSFNSQGYRHCHAYICSAL